MLARLVAALFVVLLSGCTLQPISTPITVAPNWASETLPNGFRYHLYPIEGDQVEIRLIVDVGSLDEGEDERGYAHFVEHMAFNGTRHFPHNTVFDEFAQVGVEFGPDINALTNYGRTIYQLSLPNSRSLPQALNWFRDIGDGITFDAQEVEREIGVIFGEWRQDDRSDMPWPLKLYDLTLEGSPYAGRDPIGTENTLLSATAEKLRLFHRKWYQSNRLQLVVTGGFNPEQVRRWIEEKFASLTASEVQPEAHRLPTLNNQFRYPLTLYASKGESPAIVISLHDQQADYPRTLEAQRQVWESWMILDGIQLRLEEQLTRDGISFNSLFIDFAFSPGQSVYELVVEFNAIDREEVVGAIAKNLAALRDEGLTDDEFNALSEQYAAAVGFDEVRSATEAAELAVNDLYFNSLPQSRAQQAANFERFLGDIERSVLNRDIARLLSNENQSISFVYGVGESIAGAENLKAGFFDALNKQGESVEINYASVVLPEPEYMGFAASAAVDSGVGVFRWQLGNDIPVVYLPMDESQSQAHVVIQSKGGLAALSRRERAALPIMLETYRSGMIGGYSASDFSHFLESLGSTITPQVFGNSHNYTLYSNADSLYQTLNAYRFMLENISPSRQDFVQEKARFIAQTKEAFTSPYEAFTEASLALIYPETSYESPLSIDDYHAVRFEDITALHDKLFADLGGFTVYVVADLTVEEVQAATSIVLGGISTARKAVTPETLSYNQQGGRLIKHLSPEERTYVERVYIAPSSPRDIEAVFAEDLLNRVLQNRYVKLIREQYSLSYDPFFSSWTWDGETVVTTTMTALVSPEREDELAALWPEIERTLSQPVTRQERNIAARQLLRDLIDLESDPEFMVGTVARYDLWGYDLEGLILPGLTIDKVDHRVLSTLASKLFDNAVRFETILRPTMQTE